jgi:hypothetical protein
MGLWLGPERIFSKYGNSLNAVTLNQGFAILQKERDKDESVLSNMQQYGKDSQYLDVIVADASLPLWRPSVKLDCIITDRKCQDLQTVQNGPQTRYNLYRSRRAGHLLM